MSARSGVVVFVLGYVSCLLSALATVWLIVRCVRDHSYMPPLSAPGMLAISWICGILLIQLGTVLQGRAFGYADPGRRSGR